MLVSAEAQTVNESLGNHLCLGIKGVKGLKHRELLLT